MKHTVSTIEKELQRVAHAQRHACGCVSMLDSGEVLSMCATHEAKARVRSLVQPTLEAIEREHYAAHRQQVAQAWSEQAWHVVSPAYTAEELDMRHRVYGLGDSLHDHLLARCHGPASERLSDSEPSEPSPRPQLVAMHRARTWDTTDEHVERQRIVRARRQA